MGSRLFAALVAASRVYDDKHSTSDVIAGACIGTLSGLIVVRAARRHALNRIDRWLLGVTVTPVPRGGVALAWSRRTLTTFQLCTDVSEGE